MKTLFVGDSHGDFPRFQHFVERYNPVFDQIVSVGDFGVYPNHGYHWPVNPFPCPLRFIDGNHEDHDSIADGSYVHSFAARHIRRGTAEGNVLYVGGADSVLDKSIKVAEGIWYPTETLSDEDTERILDLDIKPYAIVAHDTVAQAYNILIPNNRYGISRTPRNLQRIWDHFRPRLWIHGHHHVSARYRIGETQFIGLRHINPSNAKLDECTFVLEHE